MSPRFFIRLCVLLAVSVLSHGQTTIHVPADQPTIQAGINAANTGDTVLVAPGTYTENIDFKGKAITVTSSGGAAVTTLTGNPSAPTVSFTSGEPRSSILSKFTVSGGQSSTSSVQGGAIFLSGSSPSILNNVITDTQCMGIDSYKSSPLIQGNEVSFTHVAISSHCSVSGSGVYLYEALVGLAPQIIGNTIENNTEAGQGLYGGAGLFIDYTGAIFDLIPNLPAWPVVASNIIRNNSAAANANAATSGGGIFIQNASSLIVGNLIYGNATTGSGGGIAISGTPTLPVALINNTIANNTLLASPVAIGNDMAGGAQISYLGGDQLLLLNNIVVSAGPGAAIACDGNDPNSTYENNNIFQVNATSNASAPAGTCPSPVGTTGNIAVDPKFVDASSGNYHLLQGSASIDTGNNDAVQIASARNYTLDSDLDGNPRIANATGKATATIDMGAYEYRGGSPTVTSLTSSLNPSNYLQPVTFAAHVASSDSAAGVPTGTLTFLDGNTPLASIPVDSAGNATFTTATLAASPQAHIITAQFTPAGNFTSSTAQLSQLVNGLATSATLTVTPLAGQSTDTFTMVAAVANASGTTFGTVPTGTVNFYFNGYGASANYATLVNGVATLQATNLTPGQNTVTAVYHGDSAYAGSSSNPVVLTINGAPTSLTLSSSANPGIANTAFTITAHLTANGVAVPAGTALQLNLAGAQTVTLTTDANGLATYATTFPAPGTYLLSATFAGKNNLLPSTASYSEVLTGFPTATALTASPAPAYAGQAVTLTAASTSAGTPDAAGTITFYDGANALGTASLSPTGQATLTTSALAVGTHTLTASLAASGNVLGSSSAPVPLTVLPSTFGVVLSPANVSLQAGKTGTVAVNVSSIGAFAGPLTLSTGPMPTYATASFNTGSVTLTAAGSASANLLLNTAQEATTQPPARPGAKSWPLVFAASLAVPLGLARRRRLRQTLAVFLLLAGLCGTLTGCGFIGVPFHLVPAGTYQIPVIATDANGNQHSATLTLTITP